MAPTTRLRTNPSRTINYATLAGATGGERANRAGRVEGLIAARRAKQAKAALKGKGKGKGPKQRKNNHWTNKKRPNSEKRMCEICDDKLSVVDWFVPSSMEVCPCAQKTCLGCLNEYLVITLNRGNFHEDGGMECPYGCGFRFDYAALKKIAFLQNFRDWDEALLKDFIAKNDNFISCHNTGCGLAFSIEGCRNNGGKGEGAKAACPHCESELCLD